MKVNSLKILLMAVFASVSLILFATCKKNILPLAATQFIDTNFSGIKIANVERDIENKSLEYDVELVDGTDIKFDRDGMWLEIETLGFVEFPRTVLPDTIYKFIGFKYPGLEIKDAKKNKMGYKVEVLNGCEMYFSTTGKFLRKDK